MVRLEVGLTLGHRWGRMTEYLLHLVERNARLDHETRYGVTQRMEGCAFYAGAAHDLPGPARDSVPPQLGVIVVTLLINEDVRVTEVSDQAFENPDSGPIHRYRTGSCGRKAPIKQDGLR